MEQVKPGKENTSQRKINKNFKFLVQREKDPNIRGVILEGSSRSGKTISSVDFTHYIGARIGSGFTINCIKETYNSFKTTLYDDFNKRMIDFGVDSPFEKSKEVVTFNMLGNKINLLGADKESKFLGASCDFLYFNEMLDIPKGIFDQSEMRCRRFWWGDYNPKVTEHYVYENIIPRDDVSFLHSTWRDNPFISDTERNKILSYEDTPDNRRQGTVDLYKWKVYGLGIRAAMEGLIFPDVIYINEFPDDCDEVVYGLDFGTNDPACLVKVGIKGKNLYAEKLLYLPIHNNDDYCQYLDVLLPEECVVWADSAKPDIISYLKARGFPVYGAFKPRGSVNFGIGLLKRYNIHLVRDKDVRKEQENYKWKEIQGIRLNEPDDKWNHFWDAFRYAVYMQFRYYAT